jgi:hypothetical protein
MENLTCVIIFQRMMAEKMKPPEYFSGVQEQVEEKKIGNIIRPAKKNSSGAFEGCI